MDTDGVVKTEMVTAESLTGLTLPPAHFVEETLRCFSKCQG